MRPTGHPADFNEQKLARRKLTVVMHADVVGYSRLIDLDVTGTLMRLRRLRLELIEPAIHQNDGIIRQTAGDSFLVVFDSIDDAIQSAIAIQRNVKEFDKDAPPDQLIRFRIGIDIGDAIVDGTDTHGDGVNIAVRLESVCPPGKICISRAVRDHARNRPDVYFEKLGALTLKNISRPVEAFVLHVDEAVIAGFVAKVWRPTSRYRRFLTPRAGLAAAGAIAAVVFAFTLNFSNQPKGVARTNSIIVLPFRNIDDNSADNYLADAITVEVTTELSRLRRAWVIASGTAFTYKDKPIDVRQIGREIGVRYALEGSVRRTGAVVHVNIQLIDIQTGTNLWANRFVYETTSLFDLQDAVIDRIASSLHDEVIRIDVRREIGTLAADGNPLDQRMRVMSALANIPTPETLREARDHAEEGLRQNPNDAKLLADLADILLSNYLNSWNNATLADVDEAKRLADKAISLNPSIAHAHYDLGFAHRIRSDHGSSLAAFAKAIELDTNFAAAYAQKGNELVFLGRPKDAIPAAETALRLSPGDRSRHVYQAVIGRAYFALGDYQSASRWLAESVNGRGNLAWTQWWLIAAYALSGQDAQAQAALSAFQKGFPKYDLAWIINYHKQIQFTNSKLGEAIAALIEGLRKAGLK